MKSKRIEALAALLAIGFGSGRLLACGPDFPNNILDAGDQGVLVAPTTDFYRELERIHLPPSRFHAVVATNSYTEQNINREQADLQTALQREGIDNLRVAQITARHLVERIKLQEFNEALKQWSNSVPGGWDINTGKYVRGLPTTPPLPFPVIQVVNGLPEEFGLYFDGTIARSNPLMLDKTICRQPWEQLLKLPPAQRHFKSVAAAFMLGKSWTVENPEKAAGYFQQVRTLARSGFADSTGLAAASLGEEARLALAQKQFTGAIGLYLEQFTTGDLTAGNSLRFTAARVLQDGDADTLRELAADPCAQRVMTAYLISRCQTWGFQQNITMSNWLAAVEAANIRDADSTEEFALAAYQDGEWDLAQRWIDRSRNNPATQWLQAKLLLRAGKIDEAASLLATVSRSFSTIPLEEASRRDDVLMNESYQRKNNLPPASPATNPPVTLADDLSVAKYSYFPGDRDAACQVRGELGALHLARREYAESMNALLRAGFWMDAAYVAERVLTVDELKTYVDENWPPDSETNQMDVDNELTAENGELHPRPAIRYLLARRLTRLERGPEATVYYPTEWQSAQTNLLQQLGIGRNQSLPARERFYALVSAAHITRTNGMELIGTEVAPDWHVYFGGFEGGVSADTRTGELLPASKDELSRAAQNDVVPEQRFHYRYQAASLKQEAAKQGWEAATLLPDNSGETAQILCLSGSWLDPKPAAVYYHAILQRCRQTEIGEETARIGGFPKLDENGRVIRRKLNAEDFPQPGKAYIIHAGDTLFHIAAVVSANGLPLTVDNLLLANPKMKTDKIRAGQTMDIPNSSQSEPVQPIEESTRPTAEVEPSAESTGQTISGERYVIQSGDSLAKIAQAVSAYGWQLSVQDILDANPGLVSNQLKIGQVIVIPMAQK